MSKRVKSLLFGLLFLSGLILLSYNVWASHAFSALDAASESDAFPFLHPIKMYGCLIKSRILDDPADPIQSAANIANLIHAQIIFGAILAAVSLGFLVRVTFRRSSNNH